MLLWDFRAKATRLSFFADLAALDGFALLDDTGMATAYAHTLVGESAITIAELYVSPSHRTIEENTRLLQCVLDHFPSDVGSAIMAPSLPHDFELRELSRTPIVHHRIAEATLLSRIWGGYERGPDNGIAVLPWSDSRLDEAAELIVASYAGHVEDAINGFARSASAAREYLDGIIQDQAGFPFLGDASRIAVDSDTGTLVGFITELHAMDGVAYSTVLCVAPHLASQGLGVRLARECALALTGLGYHTVTMRRGTADPRLNRFYERMGFARQCDQPVYTWEPQVTDQAIRDPVPITP
jgi:ribosomal protein S18 acetylase RimI-like enzyme